MNVKSLGRSLLLALLPLGLAAPLAAGTLAPTSADLLVTKSGPAQAPAGSDVTYTVTITNLGPDAASTITLGDPLPGTMTFVSADTSAAPGFSCAPLPAVGAGGVIVCTGPGLAASATATFTFVFHIPAGTPPGTAFTNIATSVEAVCETPANPCPDPNLENNSGIAVTSTPPPPQADMTVTKIGPGAAGPNTDVVYSIVVLNNGPDTASSVTLNDTLPGTMTFVALAQSGTPMACITPSVGSGGTVTCTAATYLAGNTTTLTLTGHIPAGTASGTSFANAATVSAASTDPNPENDTSRTDLTVSHVDVSVTKSGPGSVTAGTTVTYTLTIANGGPDIATNVQLSDTLPPNTAFVSLTQGTGPAASCSTPAPGGTGTVTCDFAVLANGASAQFTLTLRAGNTTSITNTVSATTDSFDSNTANNAASITTTVIPSADIGVVKSGPASVAAGSTISYTIVVTNSGPSDATAVALIDALPPGTAFVSASQSTGPVFTCTTPAVGATGTITCTIATLANGATATFTIVLSVSSLATGQINNQASVTAASPDPVPGNGSSVASTLITAAPAIPPAGILIPTLSPFAVALLVLILGVLGFLLLRVRRRSFPAR